MAFLLQDYHYIIASLITITTMLMVFSMTNKKHWLLTIPLLLCFIGISYIYTTISYPARIATMDFILILSFTIMCISVALDHSTKNDLQVILRSIVILCIGVLGVLIGIACVRNIYLNYVTTFSSVCLFVMFFVFLLIVDETLRLSLYSVALGMAFLFVMSFIFSNTGFKQQQISKKQQSHNIGLWQIKDLPSTTSKFPKSSKSSKFPSIQLSKSMKVV